MRSWSHARALALFAALTTVGGAAAQAPGAPPAGVETPAARTGPTVCDGVDALDALTEMRARDVDLKGRREVLFYFYGDAGKLGGFERDLKKLGFSVSTTFTAPGRIGATKAVVSEAWLRNIVPRLCALSGKHDLKFDGWEVAGADAGALP